jgi:hypothetical protein
MKSTLPRRPDPEAERTKMRAVAIARGLGCLANDTKWKELIDSCSAMDWRGRYTAASASILTTSAHSTVNGMRYPTLSRQLNGSTSLTSKPANGEGCFLPRASTILPKSKTYYERSGSITKRVRSASASSATPQEMEKALKQFSALNHQTPNPSFKRTCLRHAA